MWLEIGILLGLIIVVTIYFLISAFNDDVNYGYIFIALLENELKNNPSTKYIPISRIVSILKNDEYRQNNFLLKFLREKLMFTEKRIRRVYKASSLIIESPERTDFFRLASKDDKEAKVQKLNPIQRKILEEFDPYDSSVYMFVLSKPKNISFKILKDFKDILLFTMIPIGVLLIIDIWFEIIAFTLGILIAVLCIWLKFDYFKGLAQVENYSADEVKLASSVIGTTPDSIKFMPKMLRSMDFLMSKIILLVFTGILTFFVSSNISGLSEGFKGDINSSLNWFLFFVDNIISVASFDISEAIELKFSNIEAVSKFAKTANVLIKFLIGISFIELIVWAYDKFFKSKEFTGTITKGIQEAVFYQDRKLIIKGKLSPEVLKIKEVNSKDFVGAFFEKYF